MLYLIVGTGDGKLEEVENSVENRQEEGIEDRGKMRLQEEDRTVSCRVPKIRYTGLRTLYLATSRPRKESNSASSGKVT